MDTLYEALTKKFSETHQIDIGEHYQDFKDLSDYVNVQFSRKDPSPSYDEFQKEVLKQSWEYFEKKFVSKIDSSRALDFVDSYDTHRHSQTNALKGLYQNTGYGQERQEMMSLVIDVDINTGTSISVTLNEPFIIDKLCNVYLDGFTTFHCNTSDSENEMAFVLSIDQFNIRTTSNTAAYNGTITIPNEQSTASEPQIVRVHKGKKFNYICQINPQKLTQITGKITAIDGTTTMFANAGRIIIEFLFVATEKMPWK